MKKKLCLAGMLFLITVVDCYSSTVLWNIVGWQYVPGWNYGLGLTTPVGDGFGMSIQVITSTMQATLVNTMEWQSAGIGIQLLLVTDGTLIDSALFSNWSGPFFQTYVPPGIPVSETDLIIHRYETVFLAFETTADYSTPSFYGWIAFTFENGIVSITSAIETTGQGIYAGTGTVVPEPSTALLAIVGLAALGLRRRKVT